MDLFTCFSNTHKISSKQRNHKKLDSTKSQSDNRVSPHKCGNSDPNSMEKLSENPSISLEPSAVRESDSSQENWQGSSDFSTVSKSDNNERYVEGGKGLAGSLENKVLRTVKSVPISGSSFLPQSPYSASSPSKKSQTKGAVMKVGESPIQKSFKLSTNLHLRREKSADPNLPRSPSPQTEIPPTPDLAPPSRPLTAIESLKSSDFYKLNAGKLNSLRTFSYAELKAATKNFSNEQMLGVGGFGAVYKGAIKIKATAGHSHGQGKATSCKVAIKKLDSKSLQGHKEWLTEVSTLGLVDHPHLVKLYGYCAENERRLLVYEYLPNTSLDRFIFGDQANSLDWSTRLNVAVGAAKGLAYLHEEVDPPIMYRDFKTSNVLLDEDFNPKLSDFGLAREGPIGEETHVSTQVRGTAGYASPEYMLTGHLTPKNDVWGFGVVLLELLTGRLCLDKQRPPHEQNLVHFTRPYLRNPTKVHRIIDPHMEGLYPPVAVEKAAELAKWCLLPDQNERPLMSEVVTVLSYLQGLK